jgi:hypothetical protein
MAGLSDIAASLDAAMIDDDEPDYDTEPEPIPAGDLDRANRMLMRARTLDRELADAEYLAAENIARIDAWRSEQRARHAARRAWVDTALEGFHRAVLAADPKRKTLELPAGKLTARVADRWTVTDPPALVEWAVIHDRESIVRRRDPEVDRVAMKKALAPGTEGRAVDIESGEFVPGVTVEPAVVTFKAKPYTGEEG